MQLKMHLMWITVKDATAGAGEDATHAAHTNFGFLSDEVVNTDEIVSRLRELIPIVQTTS